MVYARQSEYYAALNVSTEQTNSAPFVEFMLSSILETIISTTEAGTPQVSPQVSALLSALNHAKKPLNRAELQKLLGLKDRESFRLRYIQPSLIAGFIDMTIPEKPNSRLQAYRLTELGQKHLT